MLPKQLLPVETTAFRLRVAVHISAFGLPALEPYLADLTPFWPRFRQFSATVNYFIAGPGNPAERRQPEVDAVGRFGECRARTMLAFATSAIAGWSCGKCRKSRFTNGPARETCSAG